MCLLIFVPCWFIIIIAFGIIKVFILSSNNRSEICSYYDMAAENMVYKGLDEDEAGFLNMVSSRQAQLEADVLRREIQEVSEYRVSCMVWFPVGNTSSVVCPQMLALQFKEALYSCDRQCTHEGV